MKEMFQYLFDAQRRTLRKQLLETFLFKELSAAEINDIINHVTLRSFLKNEHVFFEGDPGSALYVILEGEVNITKSNKSLAKLGQGMFFGELALIENARRSATATATEKTTVLCMFKHDLEKVIKHYPRLGNKLLVRIAQILAQRLRAMNERQ